MLILTKEHIKENWFGEKLKQAKKDEILKFWNYFKERDANYSLRMIKEFLAPKDIVVLDYKQPLNLKLANESRDTILKAAGIVSEFDFLNKSWIKEWNTDYETFKKCEQEIYAFLNHINHPFEKLNQEAYQENLKNYFRYQNRQVGQSDSHCITLQVEGINFVHLLKLEDKDAFKVTIKSFHKSIYDKFYYNSVVKGIVIPNYIIEDNQIKYLENRVIEDGEIITIWDSNNKKVGKYLCEYVDNENFYIDGIYMSVNDFADTIYNRSCRYSTQKPPKAYVYKV